MIHSWAATKWAQNRSEVLDDIQHKVSDAENSKIIFKGWMYKRGKINKNWQKRWFVLRNDYYLYYYTARQRPENEFKGRINLRTCKVIKIYNDDKDKKKEFTFYVSHYNAKLNKDRIYKFCCEKAIDLIDWMSVLIVFVQTENYPLKNPIVVVKCIHT